MLKLEARRRKMINTTVSPGEMYSNMVANAEIMRNSIPELKGWRNKRVARRELAVLEGEIDVMERRLGYGALVAPYVGDKLAGAVTVDSPVVSKQVVGIDGPNEELRAELESEGMGHVNYDVATKMERAFHGSIEKNNHFLVADVGQRLYKVLFAMDNYLSRKAEEHWEAARFGDFHRVSNEQRVVREEMMPELIADCQDAVDALAEKRNGFTFLDDRDMPSDEDDGEDWERFR